jgi:pyruvate/2-oxoglutarate dehydrogenase complex dihydrolipoamide dehydrogenase (E3) component
MVQASSSSRRSRGRGQARRETPDPVAEIGYRRVEAGGIAGWDRGRDGPVHGGMEQLGEVLPTVDPQLGALVHAELVSHGVEVLTGTTVQAISTAPPGGSGRLQVQAAAADGTAVTRTADMVLVVVGVRPETALAADAGATLGSNGAIAVDVMMRTSLPDIYAAGDCVITHHRPRRCWPRPRPATTPPARASPASARAAPAGMAGLNVAAAGVETGRRGEVLTDSCQRTANPRIWAAGDVTGGPQFVYVAAAQGSAAAANALQDAGRAVDYAALPRVTFTSPAIASAGLTEAELTGQEVACDCRVLPLSAVPRAVVGRDTRGVIKLVAEAGAGRVRGVHAVADGAAEMITAAAYAIQAGMTVTDLAAAWAPYLTVSEGLRLAAQAFSRDVSRLSCCAA